MVIVLSLKRGICTRFDNLLAAFAGHGVMVSAVVLILMLGCSLTESQGSAAFLLAAYSLRSEGTEHQILSLWKRCDDLLFNFNRLLVFKMSL